MQRTKTLVLDAKLSGNVTDNGSFFTVQYADPIRVDRGARNVHVKVLQASIWNNNPNIPDGTSFNIVVDTNQFFYLPILKGLYSLSDLQSTLERALTNAGLSPTLIELQADNATQKVVLAFEDGDTVIDFTGQPILAGILGFNPTIQPASFAGELRTALYVARFNAVNKWHIHSDLVDSGIPSNNQYTNLIAIIPIDSPPGTLYNYSPNNPINVTAGNLEGGANISQLSVWLTSEDNVTRLDTLGESYSCVIEISYFL